MAIKVAIMETTLNPPHPQSCWILWQRASECKGKSMVVRDGSFWAGGFFFFFIWPTAGLVVMRHRQRAISKIEKDFNLKTSLLLCKICAEENQSEEEQWWCQGNVCFDNTMMNMDKEDIFKMREKDAHKISVWNIAFTWDTCVLLTWEFNRLALALTAVRFVA